MQPLAPRELDVLTTIVEDYIASAAPVGSKAVSRKSGLRLSPASIRSVMSELAEKGYLEQPHTSAGRAPTAKAFRRYLDMLRFSPPGEIEKRMIETWLGQAGLEVDAILRQAAKLLSSLSRQACILTAPAEKAARVRRVDFALLKSGLATSVVIYQHGLVTTRVIEIDARLSSDDLVTCSNFLSDLLADKTPTEVRSLLLLELAAAGRELDRMKQSALDIARQGLFDEAEARRGVYVDGTVRLLENPEFADLGHMRDILRMLEERSALLELLDKSLDPAKATVAIGPETMREDLKDVSLILSPYSASGQPLGAVAVIGPMRMDYAKVLPLVDFTASMLSDIFKSRS